MNVLLTLHNDMEVSHMRWLYCHHGVSKKHHFQKMNKRVRISRITQINNPRFDLKRMKKSRFIPSASLGANLDLKTWGFNQKDMWDTHKYHEMTYRQLGKVKKKSASINSSRRNTEPLVAIWAMSE